MKTNFFKEFFSSGGKVSSKRVITAAAFLLYAILSLSEHFFNFTGNEFVYNNLMYIIIGGLGLTASEQFSGKKKDEPKTEANEAV